MSGMSPGVFFGIPGRIRSQASAGEVGLKRLVGEHASVPLVAIGGCYFLDWSGSRIKFKFQKGGWRDKINANAFQYRTNFMSQIPERLFGTGTWQPSRLPHWKEAEQPITEAHAAEPKAQNAKCCRAITTPTRCFMRMAGGEPADVSPIRLEMARFWRRTMSPRLWWWPGRALHG